MRLALAASLALAGAATSQPAGAVTVWQGIATVTAASPACQSPVSERLTIDVGTTLRSVLRPRGLADNGDATAVSFVHDGQANFVVFLPGDAAGGTYSAFGASHSGVVAANRSGVFRRFVQTPKTLDPSAVFAMLSGTVQDFLFIEGCTVDFTAAYGLRP